MRFFVHVCTSLLVFFYAYSYSCTTFLIKTDNETVFGKNYDWHIGEGYITINRKGIFKSAFNQKNPVEWVSRFGNVTFIQYGLEFPNGGMNESGLVIEIMWERSQRYPEPDNRPEIDNMQWIQYQLDCSNGVDEVIHSLKEVRLNPVSMARIHYLVADRQGNYACIDFIDGRPVVYRNEKMALPSFANDTYQRSIRNLSRYHLSDQTPRFPRGTGSIARFIKAGYYAKKYDEQTDGLVVPYAFTILEEVSIEETTHWSIVYDIENRKVHFKTVELPEIKSIDLTALDYSCRSPVYALNITTTASGECSNKLEPFNLEMNGELVMSTFSQTFFLNNMEEKLLQSIINYPSNYMCRQP